MGSLNSVFHKYKKLFLLFLFLFSSGIFLFAGQLQSKAKDLGFGPALIDTGNCIIGSAPCEPSSAQEVHLFQPGPNSKSALATTAQMMDIMYTNPPNSAIVWAYDQVNRIQNKELLAVYAQTSSASNSFYFPGLGYNLLMPMMGMWQWSRNMVYMFYVVIIIFLSALILFRQNLGGTATVSLINAIPSLILSLVLVSLSYPIAGFFVDLIYIGANVAQGVLINADGSPGYEFTQNNKFKFTDQKNNDVYYLQPDDPHMSIWAIWGTSKAEIFPDDCANTDEPCINNLLPTMPEGGVMSYIGKLMKPAEEAMNMVAGSNTGSNLINMILGLTALMAGFRLFLALLKNYVLLALSPIYLPWLFLLVAIPSKTKSSIINAIKPLASASLSFVAVYILFLIMVIIGRSADFDNTAFSSVGQFDFTPPLLGYDPDVAISASGSITRTLIIYILFLASPSIPGIMNNLLNVQSSSQIASQVGQNAAGGFSTLSSGAQKFIKVATGGNKEKKG